MPKGIPFGRAWVQWLPAIDVFALLMAGTLAHLIRFRQEDLVAHWRRLMSSPLMVVVAVVAMLAVATAAELYHRWLMTRLELAIRVGFGSVLWAVVLALSTYLVPNWKFGRGLLALTASLWGFLAWGARALLMKRDRGGTSPVALIVGTKKAREDIAKLLDSHPLSPWRPKPLPMENLQEALAFEDVAVLILAGQEKPSRQLLSLHFSGVPVVVGSEVWAALEGRLPLDQLPPEIFLHQREFGAIHWEVFNHVTRVVDIALSAALLVMALPLLGLVGLGIWLIDGPPVLYHQTRLGQFGRPFKIHKFRTMHRGAEGDGPKFSSENDPRVTRLGRILRRLRLDELPQLWNVLRGEMSLVGPRPERPEFVEALSREIPYYAFRLAVAPGLTGWAQVNMGYATTLEEHRRKLEYDLYFIRERTLSLFLMVLLRTVSAGIFGTSR